MLRKKLKLSDSVTKQHDQKDDEEEISIQEKVWNLEQILCKDLLKINFKKSDKNIAAVYNPLDYAADIHLKYLKFLKHKPEVLFLGMNPGINGMAQNGVPFGSVKAVTEWMRLSGVVNKPENEIPSKPIVGLDCKIEEPSGKRFWGVIQEYSGEPENFFSSCWVQNIIPIAFLTSSGRNITPSEIKGEARNQLNTICLQYLKEAIEIFDPKIIISIGSYVNERVTKLKNNNQISEAIECKLLSHPSPRALNNQNWMEKAKEWYIENDIIKYFQHQ